MYKKNSSHPLELPENISQWETNFTEMKHKVIDYLKKHTHNQTHPIDAHHYLILNNHQNRPENPSLSCSKITKDHPTTHHHHPQPSTLQKQAHFFNWEAEHRAQRNHIFKSKCKVSLPNGSGGHCEEDCMRGLPPICSLQLERQQKKGNKGHHEATLKQKLEFGNKFKAQSEAHHGSALSNQQRYKSIEEARSRAAENEDRARASSTFKRIMGHERNKTHSQNERNIFFIPVGQFLKGHQQTINSAASSAKASKVSLPSKEGSQQPEVKGKEELARPAAIAYDGPAEAEEGGFTPIAGVEGKKQLHTGTHKRFYAHGKEHRLETNVLERQVFERFVMSPWENIREEATIANLDNQSIDP